MKEDGDEATGPHVGLHGHKPALQVICLGCGGGPSEENVTGLLVRSIASEWARGSLLAVDAGSHLAPVIRILERDFPSVSGASTRKGQSKHNGPPSVASNRGSSSDAWRSSFPEGDSQKPEPTILTTGPFAGLKFPNLTAGANALHVLRNYVSTYLITHPHLDHLSGFAVNTAAFHATSRPKTLAALPSTVDAVKQHIFNDVIWPNLTDEDGGVGFVTFQRLKEGGDVMVGTGEGRGYIDVSDRLGVKAFKVSHGVCTKGGPSHRHRASIHSLTETAQQYNNTGQHDHTHSMTRQQSQFSAPGTPGAAPRTNFYGSGHPSPHLGATDAGCVVDSSAFFIREEETNREVLIFGDVEPDSVSVSPRNYLIWQEAARKVAHGCLGGIFIECSYDDSQGDAVLFGHLNPRHLIAELQTLAALTTEARANKLMETGAAKKRKRSGPNGLDVMAQYASPEHSQKRSRSLASRTLNNDSRRPSLPDFQNPAPSATAPSATDTLTRIQQDHVMEAEDPQPDALSPKSTRPAAAPPPHGAAGDTLSISSLAAVVGHSHPDLPLAGVKVIIIHVKDTLQDGPHVSETILAQLQDYEHRLQDDGQGLGCEFVISQSGESYWF